MADLITFLVYALATARLTHMIKEDEILRSFRAAWNRRAPKGSLRAYWIGCVWCLSIAAAAAPAACWVLIPDHPAAKIPAALLTFSFLTVLVKDAQALLYGKAVLYTPKPAADTEDEEATR